MQHTAPKAESKRPLDEGTSAARHRYTPVVGRFSTALDMVGRVRPSEPVYCIYPGVLHRSVRRFLAGFPGHVLFAVKANPSPEILKELYAAGIRHFDTASLAEIELVKDLFPDAECYFMAPSKLVGAAETAYRKYGVRHFVADHGSEVRRILAFADRATTIHVRMKAFDHESVYELSSKFGADELETAALLRLVASEGRRPGLSFNVGSLCRHPDAYRRALAAVGRVLAASAVHVASLDVGGGFPVPYPGLTARPVEEFFHAIRDGALAVGLPQDCRLLCEPGRALVAEGQSLIVQVILIKDDLIFLNDGIYGSFTEVKISNQNVVYPPRTIRLDGRSADQTRSYSLSGPTCDTLDILPVKVELPVDLREGDWIEFGLAGAYTNAMSTRFNGFVTDQWARIEGPAAAPPGLPV